MTACFRSSRLPGRAFTDADSSTGCKSAPLAVPAKEAVSAMELALGNYDASPGGLSVEVRERLQCLHHRFNSWRSVSKVMNDNDGSLHSAIQHCSHLHHQLTDLERYNDSRHLYRKITSITLMMNKPPKDVAPEYVQVAEDIFDDLWVHCQFLFLRVRSKDWLLPKPKPKLSKMAPSRKRPRYTPRDNQAWRVRMVSKTQ
ncbi:hypothetical protein F5Y16DRAFT_423060 [Xylariaceae sp. FL0255]|nr:hypothetical protein F5Y16DRAFT_423060 [Xylariaceae sp. FL0255]